MRPDDEIDLVPLADGGEGTLDAFEAASRRRPLLDAGPRRTARHRVLADARPTTSVTELASASGLPLLAAPLPHDAHTRGLGRVVAAALDAGARRVVVGLGGSASTDAGRASSRSSARASSTRSGEPVADGAHGLATAVRLDASGLRPLPVGGVRL